MKNCIIIIFNVYKFFTLILIFDNKIKNNLLKKTSVIIEFIQLIL